MRKISYVLLFICIFFVTTVVNAASLSLSGADSIETGAGYTIDVNYHGDTSLASGTISLDYSNANCTISSSASGSLVNQDTKKVTITTVNGIGTSAVVATLNCTSSAAGTATFSVYSDDMYDVDVNEIAGTGTAISGSKSVTVSDPAPPPVQPDPTPVQPEQPEEPSPPAQPDPTPVQPEQPTEPSQPEQPITQDPTPVTPEEPVPADPETVPEVKIDLSVFEIVGYNLDYNIDKNQYTIDVLDSVTDLYLIVTPAVEGAVVDQNGKIDIRGKSSFLVNVTSGETVRTITVNLNKVSANTNTTPVDTPVNSDKDKSSGGGIIPLVSYVLNAILLIAVVYLYLQWKKEKENNNTDDTDGDNSSGDETDNSMESTANKTSEAVTGAAIPLAPAPITTAPTTPATIAPVQVQRIDISPSSAPVTPLVNITPAPVIGQQKAVTTLASTPTQPQTQAKVQQVQTTVQAQVPAPVQVQPLVSAPVQAQPLVSAPVQAQPQVSAPVQTQPQVPAPVVIQSTQKTGQVETLN